MSNTIQNIKQEFDTVDDENRVFQTSPAQSDISAITVSSTDSSTSLGDKILKYKYCSYVREKRQRQLWSIEYNHFIKAGGPNIFAAVGGAQFSIYESMPNGKIELQMCYQDPDAKEDFYTCCWSVIGSGKKTVLVVAGVRGVIRIVEVERPNHHPSHLIGHGSAVNQLKISQKNPFLLASASKDRSIRLWNVETKACIATFHAIESHRDEVVSIDFNHDCTRLVSGGNDHMIAIWDLTVPEIVETIEKSKRYDEKKSSQAIKTVYHPFPIFSTRSLHSNYVDSVKWHNEFIISKSNLDDVYCWKPGLLPSDELIAEHSRNAFTKLAEFKVFSCGYYFTRFTTNYDQTILALGNSIGTVQLWNLDCPDPTDIPTITLKHRKRTQNIRDLSFSRCGRDLVFYSDDGMIWLYQR